MPERSKRLSSFFAFLRPRRKDKSESGSFRVSSRSRTPAPPSEPSVAEKPASPASSTSLVSPATLAPPSLAAGPGAGAAGSPIYDAAHTATMSRMSGLNELDVADFPLPPDALPKDKERVVTRSESTPVFAHHDLDLSLSNPASPQLSNSPLLSTSPRLSPRASQASVTHSLSKASGAFLRRASSTGLRAPKSRPQSLLPPAPIPQIELQFDVGSMDVDFAPAPKQSRSTTTL